MAPESGFSMNFPVPEGFLVTLAQGSAPAEDRSSAPREIHRLATGALSTLVKPGMRVTIAFTDATRACPDAWLLGALLADLRVLGVKQEDVTLLCGSGLHRPMTAAERVMKLGPQLSQEMTVVDHAPLDPAALVDLGQIDGMPVVVNRRCVETDLLLATGVVEPHQYAGYSGGAKTVVIGCAGEATIQATHGLKMLEDPRVRLGSIEGNPFQQFVRAAGRRIGLRHVINVVLGHDDDVWTAAAGDPVAVHDHLVAQARPFYEIPVTRRAHLALAGVDPVKSSNLYQATRAATYLALSGHAPLLPGAPIIVPAAIPEGAGQGQGEQRFFEQLSSGDSPAAVVQHLRQVGIPAGAQRAYMVADVLTRHPIIMVGTECPDIVRACHMHAASSLAEALQLGARLARARFVSTPAPLDLLVVPDALHLLPVARSAT